MKKKDLEKYFLILSHTNTNFNIEKQLRIISEIDINPHIEYILNNKDMFGENFEIAINAAIGINEYHENDYHDKSEGLSCILECIDLINNTGKFKLAINTYINANNEKMDDLVSIITDEDLINDNTGKFELAVNTYMNADKEKSIGLVSIITNRFLIKDNTGKFESRIDAYMKSDRTKGKFYILPISINEDLINDNTGKFEFVVETINNTDQNILNLMKNDVFLNSNLIKDNTGKFKLVIETIKNFGSRNDNKSIIKIVTNSYFIDQDIDTYRLLINKYYYPESLTEAEDKKICFEIFKVKLNILTELLKEPQNNKDNYNLHYPEIEMLDFINLVESLKYDDETATDINEYKNIINSIKCLNESIINYKFTTVADYIEELQKEGYSGSDKVVLYEDSIVISSPYDIVKYIFSEYKSILLEKNYVFDKSNFEFMIDTIIKCPQNKRGKLFNVILNNNLKNNKTGKDMIAYKAILNVDLDKEYYMNEILINEDLIHASNEHYREAINSIVTCDIETIDELKEILTNPILLIEPIEEYKMKIAECINSNINLDTLSHEELLEFRNRVISESGKGDPNSVKRLHN